VKLSERLKEQRSDGPAGGGVSWSATNPDSRLGATEPSDHGAETRDPLDNLKSRAQSALFNRLGSRLYDASLNDDELRDLVNRELTVVLEEEQVPLRPEERLQLVALVSDDVLGYGPMEPFLNDPSVTEVMVNGLDAIYLERHGKIVETGVRFATEEQLRRVIERIVSRVGRRIDESSPMVDARLPDGSRVNAIIPPLAVDGPAVTIRKFASGGFTIDDLVSFRTLTPAIADFLAACVGGRLNVLVSGGTGSGKTTLLNVLSSFIPNTDRIVTIEDAVELRMLQEHVVRLEARPPNIEGRGEVTIRDLVRNALRMRPDRIVVGEVRSGEALDMLQAMNTGHEGSLSTLHANSPRDALARLETMVLMAGFDLPVRAIREQVASAVDLIVHTARLRDGTRRVTHIVEVDGMESDIITLTELFLYDHSAAIDADGKFENVIHPTGMRPKFEQKLRDAGYQLDASQFGVGPFGAVAGASSW
jgi:pilus assembly protein CpaF